MLPAVVRRRQRRGCGGCLYGFLVTLVILLIAAGAGWIFYLRPTIHDMAQTRLDAAMSSAIKQIPSVPDQLSIGSLPVTETEITNLIAGNLAPTDPMRQVQTTINANSVRVAFQFYGFPCAVTTVPKVVNGQLVATSVNVEGIAMLIMSPDEMMTLLNKHLVEAQIQIKHSIKSVQLKDHEMDLILS